MIYSYIKQQLSPLENKPADYFNALNQMESEIQLLRNRYAKTWTYCCGCKGYSKLSEAYEDYLLDGAGNQRVALKCGTCHSIWKFLD